MEKCDTGMTPMATAKTDTDLQGTPTDQTKYRSMIGGLMYITTSRPDIAFATFDSGFELIAYSDADLAECLDDYKSTSRGFQFLGDKLVSWSSKKQDCTAMSTAEVDIGRCNNYDVLQSIPCSHECKIVGQILIDHPLSYVLTATVDLFQDVINHTNVDYAALLWWDFMNCVSQKKDVIQYPRFTKLIIADLMKKFPSIPPRLEEDYHSIKDDISLVSAYTTRNVTVRGMLILDPRLFLPKERIGDEGERDNELYADKFAAPMIHDDVDDFGNKIEPGSLKEHPKHVDDDDDIEEEKKDEKKVNEMGSLEIRTEKMQTPIPTPTRSPRIILSLDKNINQDLTKVHKKVDQVLHEIVPQLAEIATYDLIENNLKPCIAEAIFEDHDAFRSEVPDLISQEFNARAPNIIEELFKNYVQTNVIQVHPTTTTSTKTTSSADLQQQLYLKMKSNLQDQANDPALWDVLKRKFEKSSTLKLLVGKMIFTHTVMMIIKRMMLLLRGRKEGKDIRHLRVQSLQGNVEKGVPTIFDRARMEATLNDMLSNQFRNAKENPNKPPRFLYNKDLFFLKNGNTEEKKYVLSLHKIHAEPFPEADLEEMMNRWVQKEFKNFNEDARL
ncbi:hypothetical protein Tco_1505646 [Tanacetum coccineum]